VEFLSFLARIDENTCEIESGSFKRIFYELPQGKGARSLWISEGYPVMPCGKKEVIKFIPAESGGWTLKFEYVVLNTLGKEDDGRMCENSAGVRNVFNSHNNTWNLPCKHIKLANNGGAGPFNPQ